MTLVRFEPLRDMELFHNRIRRFFNDSPSYDFNMSESFSPRIDISEDEKNILVEVEIPGVKKEDIKITLQDNILTLQGEKKKEEKEEGKNFFRTERKYGSFKRCFTLPEEIDSDKVDAKFNDGILNITLKKLEVKQAKEKEIQVK